MELKWSSRKTIRYTIFADNDGAVAVGGDDLAMLDGLVVLGVPVRGLESWALLVGFRGRFLVGFGVSGF